MTQVTIYMDNSLLEVAKGSASAAQISLSRWMAELVKEKASNQAKAWPADFWDMAGAWSESDFPDVDLVRADETVQAIREPI